MEPEQGTITWINKKKGRIKVRLQGGRTVRFWLVRVRMPVTNDGRVELADRETTHEACSRLRTGSHMLVWLETSCSQVRVHRATPKVLWLEAELAAASKSTVTAS